MSMFNPEGGFDMGALLQQAQARSAGRALCLACDLHRLPFPDGVFDQVMMVRVFHHLPDSRRALSELGRVLGGGGHLLFSYCNKKNLERVLRWLVGRNPYPPFAPEPAWVWNLFYMHHPRQVAAELHQTGFELQQVCGAGVVDKLAGLLGRRGARLPPGVSLAAPLGRLALAPWIFCDARRRDPAGLPPGAAGAAAEGPVAALMCCPVCRSRLEHLADGCRCPDCGRLYPRQDGVYNFL